MTAAELGTSCLVAFGWLHVLRGWGVTFPSQRPPILIRLTALAILAGTTLWLAAQFWRSHF